MKVLLLSCSTGGGHDSAAYAIGEKLTEKNIDWTMLDPIKLSSESFSKKVNNLYINVVNNNPNLFKGAYKLAEMYGSLKIKSPIYAINKLFAKKLEKYIEDNNINIAIATHLYPAEILTSIKKKNQNIHFIAVATDYTSIPFWEETNPDYFVIPSKDLMNEFTSKGIKEDKLLPLGIPVSPRFNSTTSKQSARKLLNINTKKPIILIMTGSMGFGNTESIIDKILEKYNNEVNVIIICGNNKEMKQNLENKYKQENVIIEGFINNIPLYMDASNIILTKPGGLTSTETAVKNILTIFTNPIPGCENHNAKFFEDRNMAYVSTNDDDTLKYIDILLTDKTLGKKMKTNQSKFINKNSTNDIVEFILKEYS